MAAGCCYCFAVTRKYVRVLLFFFVHPTIHLSIQTVPLAPADRFPPSRSPERPLASSSVFGRRRRPSRPSPLARSTKIRISLSRLGSRSRGDAKRHNVFLLAPRSLHFRGHQIQITTNLLENICRARMQRNRPKYGSNFCRQVMMMMRTGAERLLLLPFNCYRHIYIYLLKLVDVT